MAVPGRIFLSQAVFERVRTEILACYECLGPVRVKNIRDPVTIYNVDVGEVARKRSRRKRNMSDGLMDRVTKLHSPGYPGCNVSHQFLGRTDSDGDQAINRLVGMPRIKGLERAYRGTAPAHERLPGLAVLPFGEAGDVAVPRHLRDGLTCDIICQLAGLRDLRVVSHGSTVRPSFPLSKNINHYKATIISSSGQRLLATMRPPAARMPDVEPELASPGR